MKKHILLSVLVLVVWQMNAQTSAVVTSINSSCNGNNGSATVIASGADSYTYLWSDGSTTTGVSGLAAGTYTVTVYGTHLAGINLATVYQEDFQGPNTWTLNVPTGTNGVSKNYWSINDTCGGAGVGVCAGNRNGDKTLHIRASAWYIPFTYTGALYNAGGFGASTTSNAAAQSPPISTVGTQRLVLSFDFLGYGSGTQDVGSAWYSTDGGTTFTLLDAALRTSMCGNAGKWGHRTYLLPSTCNNLTNFIIRFNWTNNDDGQGSDPAVAINNVHLGDSVSTTGVVTDSVVKTVIISNSNVHAEFQIYKYSFGGIYHAKNLSTGTGLKYLWTFGDGTSYKGKSPIYAFWTAGYWSVCLTVTDANGCSDTYCDSSFYDSFFKKEGEMMTEFRVDDDEVATDVDEVEATSIEIYPNPAVSGQLNINAYNFVPQTVAIYNMDGRKVLDEKYLHLMDISALRAGIYFIEVTGNSDSVRKRFQKL